MANERILVLDDESTILEILGQFLEDEEYRCTLTTSPTEALEYLEQGSYSLLLTDLKMPEMHGMEVVRRAKEIAPDLSIIVVTALLETTNAIDAMRAGADDYLLKPFNLGEISLSVKRVLERRELILQNREYQHRLEERVQEATSDLARTNAELQQTKDYLENLLHSSVDVIFTLDEKGVITYANRGTLRMLKFSPKELVGTSLSKLFTGEKEELLYVQRIIKEYKLLQNYETELILPSGDLIPVNISFSQVVNPQGEVIATVAICKDITQQKRLERELKEMTIKDSLTDLFNQRYFYDRLEREIERAKRQKHPLSLLLFDVDKFKTYNDCHGHLEGDRVLREIGKVVVDCTREHVDVGFRYGGDEFTVILPEAGEEQALLIANRILSTFEARRFDDLTLSIGLMQYPEGASLRSFIRLADAKMYDAKRSGGNQVMVFRPDEVATESE